MIKKRHTLRLPIRVKLFDKNNKVVQTYQRTIKNRIMLDVQVGLSSESVLKGTCRVTYNMKEDYWNEFDFTTFSEFRNNLTQITEKDLVKEFI